MMKPRYAVYIEDDDARYDKLCLSGNEGVAMATVIKTNDIGRVAILPELRDASAVAAELMKLWPLSEALQMDNDAKYGENLQVRMTQTIARVITGEDVTVPDAEYVYEGASEIPGRPQSIVEALLRANEAYDTIADYSESGDTKQVMAACAILGVDWDQDTVTRVAETLESIGSSLGTTDDALKTTVDPEGIAQRFALSIVSINAFIDAIGVDNPNQPQRALPVVLFLNEIQERLAIPRLFLSDHDFTGMLSARSEGSVKLISFAQFLSPLAQHEWKRHLDDVLWDPTVAKEQAKAEDERKNKEALAAKFAHVQDDEGKEHVEL